MHDGDMLWGAITSGAEETPGAGFTMGGLVQGNITEYRLADGPAQTVESVTFPDIGDCEITAVTIKPM